MRKQYEYISDIEESILKLGVGVMMINLRDHVDPEIVRRYSQNVLDEYLSFVADLCDQNFREIEIAFHGLIHTLSKETTNEDARGASRGGLNSDNNLPIDVYSRNVSGDVLAQLSGGV